MHETEPSFQITIWPNSSLKPLGFVWVMGLTFAFFMLPLLVFLGSSMLWAMALPVFATFFGLWWAFKRNYKDRSVHEHIRIWPDLMTVDRVNPRSENQSWQANPHWVTVKMRDTKEMENYLTLVGGGREIEVGSFLVPVERQELYSTLLKEIRKHK